MSQIQFRISDNDPYVYMEPASGSVAIGTDNADGNKLKIVVSNAIGNIDPSSATASISIDPSTNGNISFKPQGTGQSTFLTGDVALSSGNLDMTYTNIGATTGAINLNGQTFIHNYSDNNGNSVFVGLGAGFVNTGDPGGANTGIGVASMPVISGGFVNTLVGSYTGTDLTIGNYNTGIGGGTLGAITSGSNNIAVGYNAGTGYLSSESSNIAIGNLGTISESHVIRIGTQGSGIAQQNVCYIAGINGATNTSVGVVGVASNGKLAGSNGTNGQIQIGGGSGPVWANLTSSGATVTITNTANGINLEASGGSSGITWSVITGSTQAATVNSGYICNYNGTLVVTLPATAAVGTQIGISGMFNVANNWQVTQNAGQQIFYNSSATTVGVSGYLQSSSTNFYCTATLVCNVANTSWIVLNGNGNITVN